MSKRSADHGTFVIERAYDVAPGRVFAAWAEPAAKRQWFGPPDGAGDYELDFRPGGREHLEVGMGDVLYTFDALYEDIVPDERIVYSSNMHRDGIKMSVSVSTVEFLATAEGTQLRYTEQGVYLDGIDTPEQREHGTAEMIDRLGEKLAQGAGV